MEAKRIMLVDDHPVFCSGLAQIIGEEDDLMVCGQAENCGDALHLVPKVKPDVMVVDITLNDRSGVDLIHDVKANWPLIQILVVSMHEEELYMDRVFRVGARGYVQKDERPETIVEAIRHLLDGYQYWSQGDQTLMHNDPHNLRTATDIQDLLADREFEVFQLIAQGYRPKDIAGKLALSVNTVERHRSNIRQKLKCSTSSDLTKFAVEWGRVK